MYPCIKIRLLYMMYICMCARLPARRRPQAAACGPPPPASAPRRRRGVMVGAAATLARELPGHTRWVHDCCLSPDGALALSCGYDGLALAHALSRPGAGDAAADPPSAGPVRMQHGARVRACCLMGDGGAGNWVAATCSRASVRLWDLSQQAVLGRRGAALRSTLRCDGGGVGGGGNGAVGELQACCAGGDGGEGAPLVFGGADRCGDVIGWDPRAAETPIMRLPAAGGSGSSSGDSGRRKTGGLTRLAVEPVRQQWLCAASIDGSAAVWDLRTQRELQVRRHG
jgi:WD40 repeat protein